MNRSMSKLEKKIFSVQKSAQKQGITANRWNEIKRMLQRRGICVMVEAPLSMPVQDPGQNGIAVALRIVLDDGNESKTFRWAGRGRSSGQEGVDEGIANAVRSFFVTHFFLPEESKESQ